MHARSIRPARTYGPYVLAGRMLRVVCTGLKLANSFATIDLITLQVYRNDDV